MVTALRSWWDAIERLAGGTEWPNRFLPGPLSVRCTPAAAAGYPGIHRCLPLMALCAPPPDLAGAARGHGFRPERSIFGGVPLGGQKGVLAGQVVLVRMNFPACTHRTAAASYPGLDLSLPLMALFTDPPHLAVAAGQDLIRGECAVFWKDAIDGPAEDRALPGRSPLPEESSPHRRDSRFRCLCGYVRPLASCAPSDSATTLSVCCRGRASLESAADCVWHPIAPEVPQHLYAGSSRPMFPAKTHPRISQNQYFVHYFFRRKHKTNKKVALQTIIKVSRA